MNCQNMSYRVDREVRQKDGSTVTIPFIVSNVGPGHASIIADMMKWDAECEAGYHEHTPYNNRKYDRADYERIRDLSDPKEKPQKKRKAA